MSGRGVLNSPDLMFLSDVPAEDDDIQNAPLVGRVGDMFNMLLLNAGINRASCYVTHTVKCRPIDKTRFRRSFRPPYRIHYNNRKPLPAEFTTCGTLYLDSEIKAVKPKVIVAMGNISVEYLMGKYTFLSNNEVVTNSKNGKPKSTQYIPVMKDLVYTDFWSDKYGCYVVPMHHPSFVIRSIDYFIMMVEVLKKAKRLAEFGPGREVTESFIATDFDSAMAVIDRAAQHRILAYDHETDGLDWRFGELINTGFSWKEGTGATIRWLDTDGRYLYTPDQREKLHEALRARIFQDKGMTLVGYHEPYDASWTISKLGFDIKAERHDVQLLYHTLNTSATHTKQSLEILSWLYTDMANFKAPTKTYFNKRQFVECPIPIMSQRNCADVDATLRLFNRFYPKVMVSPTAKHYKRLLIGLPKSATVLHLNGANVSLTRLKSFRDRIEAASKELGEEFCREVGVTTNKKGGKINLRSSKQLGEILFEKLKLPVQERTPTGAPRTSDSALAELHKSCPALDKLMKYKKLQKLLGTYVLGLRGCAIFGNSRKRKPEIWSVKDARSKGYMTDGRVHPTFSVVGTVTGRPSVSNPNIANQPRPTPQQKKLGIVLRRAFTAPKGSWILEDDLSQAELRVLAAISGDEELRKAVNSKEGVHRRTAAVFFNVKASEVTDDQKAPAKTVVFAITYGGTERTVEEEIAEQLDDELKRRYGEERGDNYIPTKDERLRLAKEWIESWRAQYPKAGAWIDRQKLLLAERGYVVSVFGRVFQFPMIFSKDYMVRSACERAAINYLIQGPASDITFMAGQRIQEQIEKRGLKSKWTNMVYDANFYEVPDAELKEMRKLVKEEMERPVPELDIEIRAEEEIGRCWKEEREDDDLKDRLSAEPGEKDRHSRDEEEEEEDAKEKIAA